VPATVKWNWEAEAKRFTPALETHVVSGRVPYRLSHKPTFIIINYDILKDWVQELLNWNPTLIVLDEAHFIKNTKTKRSKAAIKLAQNCKHVICLTGTPVVNCPVEFYRCLKLIAPNLFPSFWRFAQRYCGAHHNGFGWDFRGASNELELHKILTKKTKIMKRYLDFLNEDNYDETYWSKIIGGKDVTIKISEIENYLKTAPVIKILVDDIKDMCIHKNKKDETTRKRADAAELKYPIIISKNLDGKYNMILDGHHRLQKAINTNEKFIKAKVLDLKTSPKVYQMMFR